MTNEPVYKKKSARPIGVYSFEHGTGGGPSQRRYTVVHDQIVDRYRMYIRLGVCRHCPGRVHHLQDGPEAQAESQGKSPGAAVLIHLYIYTRADRRPPIRRT